DRAERVGGAEACVLLAQVDVGEGEARLQRDALELGRAVGPERDRPVREERAPAPARRGRDVVHAAERGLREGAEQVGAPEVAAEVLEEEPLRAALLERAERLLVDQAGASRIREVPARALEVRDGEVVRLGDL